MLGQPAVVSVPGLYEAHRQPALVEAQLRDPEFCERYAEAYAPAAVER